MNLKYINEYMVFAVYKSDNRKNFFKGYDMDLLVNNFTIRSIEYDEVRNAQARIVFYSLNYKVIEQIIKRLIGEHKTKIVKLKNKVEKFKRKNSNDHRIGCCNQAIEDNDYLIHVYTEDLNAFKKVVNKHIYKASIALNSPKGQAIYGTSYPHNFTIKVNY